MSSIPPTPLTTTARRAEVAGILARHTIFPVSAMFTAELLDQVNAALLRTAGVTDSDARLILAAMWGQR